MYNNVIMSHYAATTSESLPSEGRRKARGAYARGKRRGEERVCGPFRRALEVDAGADRAVHGDVQHAAASRGRGDALTPTLT